MVFPVAMFGCELDCEESWALKNLCLWTVVLEKTLESPLDCKEIQPVHPKGKQSWIFIGRIDAETPILWLPDMRNWLIGKEPDAGKDWRWEEKRTTEDEMVDGITDLMDMSLSKLREFLMDRESCVLQSMGSQRVRHNWATELNCHSFSSQEQTSFNFMAAVTICSDFGAQEKKVCHCFHFSQI